MPNKNICLNLLYFLVTTLFAFCPSQANSQVTSDLTTNTQVNTNGNTAEITGGKTIGANLFHSFQEFSVQTGNEAFFNNNEAINNIFSRITGGDISDINGLIRANGSANLFLINPAGIIFGEGARLDIGGSFLATTADEIKFENDRFSAIAPEEKPILTINVPIGLGFGSEPGDIIVRGAQNNVAIEIPSFRVITDNLPEGIRVNSGENISLIGGNINFDGGGLQASGGNIELGSVGNNEAVNLVGLENGWFKAGYDNGISFNDISFDNAAYVDVSNEVAGNINIDGRQILVNDGSVILANTSLPTNNSINLNASELLELKGTSGQNDSDASLGEIINISRELETNPQTSDSTNISPTNSNSNFYSVSLIGADILSGSNGTGNDINIDSNTIRVFDAAQIRTAGFSASNSFAGDINLNTQNILVKGTNNIDGFTTSLITSTTGIGTFSNGGDINISTRSLQVEDGGAIKPDTFSRGSAGKLKITAENILLKGVPNPNEAFRATGLIANAGTSGTSSSTAGNIEIDAKSINILEGALINTSSFGQSVAGNITIKTEELNVVGSASSQNFSPSGIIAAVNNTDLNPDLLTSKAGSINIDTNQLNVLDGARIEADTTGGNSGNININAQDIELNGTRPRVGSFIGGLSTSANAEAFGNGGNIQLKTGSLTIANGSVVRAISLGSGDAGNIEINAQAIEIFGVDRFAENPISSEGVSKISTGALDSNGGNININSGSIELDDFGEIQASTQKEGQGGNISLNTQNIILQDTSNIGTNAIAGDGGNVTIDTATLIAEKNSEVTANAFDGKGGNISIDAEGLFLFDSPENIFSASSELGIDGEIQIDTPDINLQKDLEQSELEILSAEQAIANSCLARSSQQGSFNIGDNGGLPKNPNSNYSDADFSLTGVSRLTTTKQPSEIPDNSRQQNSSAIPAQKMVQTESGRIFLVAGPYAKRYPLGQKPESFYCQSAEGQEK